MRELSQLQKQQVGLRLPKYLIDELDEISKEYSLNRGELIAESVKAFIDEQKMRKFYKDFDSSCKELKDEINSKYDNFQSLDELIDEISD